MIRYNDGGSKVLTKDDFHKETQNHTRENDPYWLTLSTVQLVPASKIGIGKTICFDFLVHGFQKKVNDSTNRHDIDYHEDYKFDYKKYLGDLTEKELMLSNPTNYCLMVCHKIGYYLKLVHEIDLRRMSVEFSIVEFGAIWLFYVHNIITRVANKLELDYEKIIPDFVKNEAKREQQE